MIRPLLLACSLAAFVPALAAPASAQVSHADYQAMVERHASANGIPASLVHRIIMRESRYNAHAVSRGNYGLMQIKPATARAMGYTGSAAGLLDPDVNMTYAVKYLAGAYRVAGGNSDRAVGYYARGYYYAAKHQGIARADGTLHGMKAYAAASPGPVPSHATALASAAPGVVSASGGLATDKPASAAAETRPATVVPGAASTASPEARAEMTW